MSSTTTSSSGGNLPADAVRFAGDNSIYRWSSMGSLVVSYDAYRYTMPRYANLASIGCITIIGMAMIAWYRHHSLSSSRASLPYLLNAVDRHRLSLLAMIALAANGYHFIDNFARIEVYHLPRWIYHGWFVPLDNSCLYWHISAGLCLLSCIILLSPRHVQDTTHVVVAANGRGVRYWLQRAGLLASSSPLERVWLARYAMYTHCFMIWTGQGHYLFEPPSMFETSANLSIWAEGSTAILLHIYTAVLAQRMINNCSNDHATNPSSSNVQLSTIGNVSSSSSSSSSSDAISAASSGTTAGTVESAPLIDPSSLSSSDVIMRRRSRSGGMAPDNL